MAIQDNVTIDYSAQTIKYTGGFDGDSAPNYIYTVNELYTWLQDVFDEPAQMNAPVPMSAQTPVDYTFLFPWFVDNESMRAFYGGAVQTSSWNRVVGTARGIVMVEYTGATNPTSTDIGKPAVDEAGDTGVLVGYDTTRKILWIRPDTSATANDFDSTTGNVDITGGTQNINIASGNSGASGESSWLCLYTLGGIQANTEIHVFQVDDFEEVATPEYKELGPWWYSDVDFSTAAGVVAGHIDLLIKVREVGNLIDEGRVLILARQYTKTYAHYEVIATGGRTPIPLATLADLDNKSGNRTLVTDAATGSWTEDDVGNPFRKDGVGNERQLAVMSAISGTSPSFTIEYYLIGKGTDFADNNILENIAETKTLTILGSPGNAGPASDTSITVTFGGTVGDIDEDGSNEYYSVALDCNSQSLADVYERLKHLVRQFESSNIDSGSQTIIGEYYRAIGEYYVPYDTGSIDNPFTEGETITWGTTGEGILTSKHDRGTSEGFLILRQVRGESLDDNDVMTGGTSSHTANVDTNSGADPVGTITEVGGAPFGTFAGGKAFFARGVKPVNVKSSEASSFQCTDSEGNIVDPPLKVSVSITGLVSGDRGAIFEVATAGTYTLNKSQHGLSTGNGQGDLDIVVDSAIPNDTPGKATGGVIRCVDISVGKEHRYRYASWSGSTFTLVTAVTGTATSASTTQLIDTVADFGGTEDVEVGDMVRNTTDSNAVWVVTKIVNTTTLDVTLLESGGVDDDWDISDAYVIHQLVQAYNGAEDEAYVPLIDGVASGSSLGNTLVYVSNIDVCAYVRQSSAGTKILPFKQTSLAVTNSGLAVAAIRTSDPIVS